MRFRPLLVYAGMAFCLCALYTGQALAADTESIHNPAPAKDDLVLPGPGGSSFVFRPVSVRSKGGPLGGARFIMGDPAGDFRSPPTAVVVGGAFAAPADDGTWIYYMGKYEITEAQYYALMGSAPDKSKLQSNMPMANISYFDAMLFIDRLNTWLYANAMKSLPTSGPFPGFVRLPTEAEWEYAARGGGAVEAVTFDAAYPYDDLAPYEWFSGPPNRLRQQHAARALFFCLPCPK